MSRLDLIVGPNGSGKSTFVEFVLADARPGVPFVNADLIAQQRWPDDPVAHGHDAAAAAQRIRDELLGRGESFIAETVASHPAKVELVERARGVGYHVHLIVIAVPEALAVARVAARVDAGGHAVPEVKIRARYARLWVNVIAMVDRASSAEVVDNSGPQPRTVATFVAGQIVGRAHWPAWIPLELVRRWP